MPDSRQFCVFVAAKSDPGRDPDKQENEDALGYRAIGGTLIAVVCDGMGGHRGGRLASHTAVEVILRGLGAASPERASCERLHLAIEQASSAVYQIGGDAPMQQRPGATCVAIWLHADSLELAHVGDSRCYRWRLGKLEPLTRDHSVIESFIQAGQVPKEQAHLHPDAHRITRALGIEPKVDVELRSSENLMVGDRFLLCSDGLTDLVPDSDLAAILARPVALPQLVDELLTLANQRGGHDNVTALLLEIADARGLSPAGTVPSFALTTPRVAAVATEQFPARPDVPDRTLPIQTVDRTVIMAGQAELSVVRSPQFAAAKTQPLQRMNEPTVPPLRTAHLSDFPMSAPRPSRQRPWLLIGVALILIGLAILIGLFRRH